MKKILKISAWLIIIVVLYLSMYRTIHPKLEVISTETYIVSDKDTLWKIADQYIDETVDIREYLDLIHEYNGQLTTDIKEGQAIIIPILKKGSAFKRVDFINE